MENKVTIEAMITILEEAKLDYHKFYDNGNKAASTRLRKKLQDVSTMCKDGRKEVIEHKKTL